MAATWVVNGWRQQERTPRAICKALEIARARGMQSYAINRVGKYYWLVCSRDSKIVYDLAITVRRFYAKVKHGIYLAVWREQLVMIVWRDDVLQHCLACQTNEEGMAHLQLLLERLTRKSRRHASLLLARSVPDSLADYCVTHLAQWHMQTGQSEINELSSAKFAKLKDVAVPTPWQQRQRAFTVILLVLSVAGVAAWYFWPEQHVLQHDQVRVQQALPEPSGVLPSVLQELPQLFYGMEHLAGWQWRSASLVGQRLSVQLHASYGRPEELAHQLNSAWQIEPQRQQTSAHYTWPTEPFVRQQAGFSINQLNTETWQRHVEQLFPAAEMQQGRVLDTPHYRKEVFTIRFGKTDFTELARLRLVLTHPHLRLVKLNLQAADTLRAELDVHLLVPQPISKEGVSS